MKIGVTKALSNALTVVSWAMIGLSVAGAINLAFPEYMGFVKELVGYDKTAVTSLAIGSGGVGLLGVVGRTLKNSFNTQNALLIARHNAEIEVWKKEKELLVTANNEFMVAFTEKQGEQVVITNELNKKIDLSLKFQIAYSKERLNMSDNLVPQDVKREYRAFLDSVNEPYEVVVEPLIVSETIEKEVEVEVTTQQLKEREKARKLESKANTQKGVGVR